MHDYRVYLVTEDGHIVQRLDFVHIDERAARARAEQLAIDYDVELWELAERIAIYRCATCRARKPH